MFLFSSVIPFLIKLDIKFISPAIESVNGYMDLQFFGGWTLYFVLGYYIGQHSFSKKEKLVVYTLALAALVFTFERTILYCLRNGEPFGILSYEYPNIYLISIGVMVFFKEEVSRIHMSVSAVRTIETLSKLTLGVYLMHVLLLRIFYQLGLNLQIAPNVMSVPIVSFVVLISGGVISAIVKRLPFVGKYIL
jgi:surface polysaccharide O-acyltransferase-like enzyme